MGRVLHCLQGLPQSHLIGENRSSAFERPHAHDALIKKLHSLALMRSQMLRNERIHYYIDNFLSATLFGQPLFELEPVSQKRQTNTGTALGPSLGITREFSAFGSCLGAGAFELPFGITVDDSSGVLKPFMRGAGAASLTGATVSALLARRKGLPAR